MKLAKRALLSPYTMSTVRYHHESLDYCPGCILYPGLFVYDLEKSLFIFNELRVSKKTVERGRVLPAEQLPSSLYCYFVHTMDKIQQIFSESPWRHFSLRIYPMLYHLLARSRNESEFRK